MDASCVTREGLCLLGNLKKKKKKKKEWWVSRQSIKPIAFRNFVHTVEEMKGKAAEWLAAQ